MKILIFAITMMISGLASADQQQQGLGEMDLQGCECKTCLIENGVCVRTPADGDRYVPDKNSQRPRGNKRNAAGATKT